MHLHCYKTIVHSLFLPIIYLGLIRVRKSGLHFSIDFRLTKVFVKIKLKKKKNLQRRKHCSRALRSS